MAVFASSMLVSDALHRIGGLFGGRLAWTPGNPFQDLILRHELSASQIAKTLPAEQLFGVAAHSVRPVNAFLVANGFGDVQLEDMGSGDDMAYVASILRLIGAWLQTGESGYHICERRAAFRLEAHPGLAHFTSRGQRLVRIATQSGFDMWLADQVSETGFDMIDEWIELISVAGLTSGNGAVLPYVKVDNTKVDISKLIGMRAGNVVIQQALSAARFKLTHHKVSFEMAVAMSARKMALEMKVPEPGDFVVGETLNFALVRRQTPLVPLAVGQVNSSEFSFTSDIV